MNIVRKVGAVEKLFAVLDKDILKLQQITGISCVENCILCCTSPRIEATALEFYPLAYHLFLTRQAEYFLEKIEQNNDDTLCPILNRLTIDGQRAGCMHYKYRGLICRLFSYSHATNKHGARQLVACKTIKTTQQQQYEAANQLLQTKPFGPGLSNYYSRLQIIDFNEAGRMYPVGSAIKHAIIAVLTNMFYRGKKAM